MVELLFASDVCYMEMPFLGFYKIYTEMEKSMYLDINHSFQVSYFLETDLLFMKYSEIKIHYRRLSNCECYS